MSNFHSLEVLSVERLTPNAVALTFHVPDSLKEVFMFTAGQYITLKTDLDGKEIRRAYSISSSPSSGKLTVGIKKVAKGAFSTFANEQISAGDKIAVMAPEGRFVFPPKTEKTTIAAFAAGSGITPILSIAQSVLEAHDSNRFVLVYGNKTLEEVMFRPTLLELQEKYPDRFFVQWVFSRSNEEGALFGRIDNATVNLVIKNKFKDYDFDRFYLCGPEDMIATVSETLQKNGVSQDRILFELFTTSDSKGELKTALDGKTQLTVVLDDEQQEITMDQKEFVLDAVLKHDIDAPYSCQGGVCSSCIARVVEGEAEMAKNQILTDHEVEEGLILTCQAHAKTPILKVDFDDV